VITFVVFINSVAAIESFFFVLKFFFWFFGIIGSTHTRDTGNISQKNALRLKWVHAVRYRLENRGKCVVMIELCTENEGKLRERSACKVKKKISVKT